MVMSIEVAADGKAHVDTMAEALQVCYAPNVSAVVIRDVRERAKLQRVLRTLGCS